MKKDENKQDGADRQTNRQTDRQTNRQTGRQTNRTMRNERRERLKNHRRWVFKSLFDDFGWKRATPEERKARIVRDLLILAMTALSILMYWVCFLDSSVSEVLSVFIFLFYLVPVSIVSVLYGWFGGVICFTPVFIAATLMSPSNAYFPFFHLVAIYVFSYIKTKSFCRSIWRMLVCGFCSGMILSAFYYVIFVLVTSEAFSEITAQSLILHIVNIVPQSVMICTFIYWFGNHCSPDFKRKLGSTENDEQTFVNMVGENVRKGYRSVSGRIFVLFLVEAVIMGIAAAFFANSLIPRMLERNRPPEEVIAALNAEMPEGAVSENETPNTEMPEGAVSENETPNTEMPEGVVPEKPANGEDRRPPWLYGEFSDAFVTARDRVPQGKFAFDDQGIAFDLKLIMMLLCVIHPIVLVSNYIGQKLIALPIVDITNVMSDFGDDADKRLEIEGKLENLEVHSEDEIEALYGVIGRMVGELNSYIDNMRREQQLQEDLRVAKAASEAKSNFLSNVSHEIRTPINAVLGLDEMILRESGDEDIRKYAFDIKNAGKTLLALINDLLDFSKIEAGKLEIIPAEYELSSTINDLINMVSAKAADKGLKLCVDVASDTPHVLFGDEIRIKQCALNILNNAVKYTHEGSVSLYISGKKLSEDEAALCVRVVDTGIGIKEEDLSKLYSPFERIEESRNRSIEGTGLGMSIVKRLLEMMGTQLVVKSVYGEGSDFSFEVAQKVINWEPIGDFNETYQKSIDSMDRYQVSFIAPDAEILVVDDTPMNLNVIKGLLKPTKVKVDTAASGAECLDMVGKKAYDIIFMDQRMPGMDGTETFHALREMGEDENLSKSAPVIILTANVVAGAREAFLREGFSDYLSKPIDAVKLEKTIAEYLPSAKVLPADESAAETDKASDSGFAKRLSEVDGIDVKAALANCMNEEILEGAVHDFYVSAKTGPDRIEELWKSGNIREYTVAVHALKSSSRLIGALGLSAMAAELEAMGDANETETIDLKTPELIFTYRSFYDKLSAVCEESQTSGDDDARGREPIDPGQLAEAYGAVKEAVTAFDYDTADEIIKTLKEYALPADESERFDRICDLVTKLDRDALLEEL